MPLGARFEARSPHIVRNIRNLTSFLSRRLELRRCLVYVPRPQPSSTLHSRAYFEHSLPVTINISSPTPAVIVLAQVDTRSFAEIAGPYRWSLEFALYKKGESEPIGRSVHDRLYGRSVQMELDLEEGDYVVHVRACPLHSFEPQACLLPHFRCDSTGRCSGQTGRSTTSSTAPTRGRRHRS